MEQSDARNMSVVVFEYGRIRIPALFILLKGTDTSINCVFTGLLGYPFAACTYFRELTQKFLEQIGKTQEKVTFIELRTHLGYDELKQGEYMLLRLEDFDKDSITQVDIDDLDEVVIIFQKYIGEGAMRKVNLGP